MRVDLAKGEHKAPDYLAINPNGKVPALVDGDTKLWESNAIMCHLARAAKSDLWPTDPNKQIEVLKWLSWNSEHFTRHAGTLYFNYHIKPKFDLGEPDMKAVEEATGFLQAVRRGAGRSPCRPHLPARRSPDGCGLRRFGDAAPCRENPSCRSTASRTSRAGKRSSKSCPAGASRSRK